MPLYYFALRSKGAVLADREAVDLPDLEAARAEAVVIARELMRNREARVRGWRVQVCDDYLVPCCDILFAEVDETLDYLPAQHRESIHTLARLSAALDETFGTVRASLGEVRKSLARGDSIVDAVSSTNRGQKPG